MINQNNFLPRYRSGHGLTGVLRSYVIAVTDRSGLAETNTTQIMLLYLLVGNTGNSHVGTFIFFVKKGNQLALSYDRVVSFYYLKRGTLSIMYLIQKRFPILPV